MKQCPECNSKKIEETEFSIPAKRHFHCLHCGYFFSADDSRRYRKQAPSDASMNLEIVDCYVTLRDDENEQLDAILHAYLIDIHAHLKGIQAIKRGEKWYFTLPHQSMRDIESRDHVRFPVFTYSDHRKTEVLRALIQERGIEYIERKILKSNGEKNE